jgi:hypothetical protein
MNKLILFLLLLTLAATDRANAQTWNEWFKQKKTQRKYHYEQIAALQVHLDNLKKGITIVYKGLTTIHNIKNGDFNLHRDFFGSLKNVNPRISNSAKVADIIAFQVYVIQNLKRINNYCKNNESFTADEIRYVALVYSNMLFLTDASISELLDIIRSDKTEMKDDERLNRIDNLYEDMLDKHAFVTEFGNEVVLLSHQREKEKREAEILKKLNGITL